MPSLVEGVAISDRSTTTPTGAEKLPAVLDGNNYYFTLTAAANTGYTSGRAGGSLTFNDDGSATLNPLDNETVTYPLGADATISREFFTFDTNEGLDSNNFPFRMTGTINEQLGEPYNYVFELGHDNKSGGSLSPSATRGQFRIALESCYEGDKAECHYAAVRSPALALDGKGSEWRCWSGVYNQDTDDTQVGGVADQFSWTLLNDARDQSTCVYIRSASNNDFTLHLVNARQIITMTATASDALTVTQPTTSTGKFLTLTKGSGTNPGYINTYGQHVWNANATGSGGIASEDFLFTINAATANWGFRVDDAHGLRLGVSRAAGSSATQRINYFGGMMQFNDRVDIYAAGGSNLSFRSDTSGNLILGRATTGTVGFYGSAGVAKQTGVAVDAASIHAALVALNLIGV